MAAKSILGVACCTPAPPSQQPHSGSVETWGEMPVYVNGPDTAKAAIILLTDVFGFAVPQLRVIADLFAEHGYFVAVPDNMHGDPIPDMSVLSTWLPKHMPEASVQETKEVGEYIKSKKGINKFGLVGFCWGAKLAMLLALEGFGDAIGFFHPSLVTVEEIKAVKVPVGCFGSEFDDITPLEVVEKMKEARDADPVLGPKSVFKVVPGAHHGYTTKYNPDDKAAVELAYGAYNEMLNFLDANLS